MTKRLNIIGCGQVGKTLARLWARQGVFEIGDIVNRSQESTRQAVAFIGAGFVAPSVCAMRPAQVFLIATPDDYIVDSATLLAGSGALKPGSIVFHCSGALPSSDLEPVTARGAVVASVHPVKSFADAENSAATFDGTFCGVEGDARALEVISPAFEAIGARLFTVDPDNKTVYHAANVIVCNYLNALLEFGTLAYAKAGLDRQTAMQVMQPIVHGTVDNIFRLGTDKALTGPIARGDDGTVARQLDALSDWDPGMGELYRNLGRVALELSRRQGAASAGSLSRLAEMLK